MALELEAVVDPDLTDGVDEVVHHVSGVVRRGRKAQQLLAARHRRVVDRLQVDIVLRHQIIRKLHDQLWIADLQYTNEINAKHLKLYDAAQQTYNAYV